MNKLPTTVFARLGPYYLVPKEGETDLWAIPGRWYATTGQLHQMAARNNWQLTINN
jgi:hypothetical protein